jgi:hypothetical protein
MKKIFQRMSPEERAFTVARAKSLAAYGKAVEEVAAR